MSGHHTGSGAGAISYTSSNSTVATVDASSGKLTVKALGTAVITVTQSATATHTGGSASYTLTVTKSDAPKDIAWKSGLLSKSWSSGGSFSKAEILGNVAGTTTGYDLKTIANVSDSDVSEVSGKAINFKNKVGNFTADIVLVHSSMLDVRLAGAKFEITKGDTPVLTWTAQRKVYGSGGELSSAELSLGLTGNTSARSGYTLKSVRITDAASTGAVVSGSGSGL